MKCLLIETKNKKYITHEKYLSQLVEFAKTFGATISIIDAEGVNPLKIEDLVPAICDQNYKSQDFTYKILETKLKKDAQKKKNRSKTLTLASKIQEYIYSKFLDKKIVSLKDLKKKFKKYELSDAALCNHIRKMKETLEKEGYIIQKVGVGMYSAT